MKLSYLIESPDYSLFGDSYEQKDAVTFSYYKYHLTLLFHNKLIHKNKIFNENEIKECLKSLRIPLIRTHGMMIKLVNSLYYNTDSWQGENTMQGRLWLKNKIISFWNIPLKYQYEDFKHDIKRIANIKIDNWPIDVGGELIIEDSLL